MRLQISPRNHEHINRKISSGRYGSADDVLQAALALLDEREAALARELRDVQEQVDRATAQADAGELAPAAEAFAGLRRRNSAWRVWALAGNSNSEHRRWRWRWL